MKITIDYFVLRSSALKAFVHNVHHVTQTKILSAAQKFDTKEEAELALDSFVRKSAKKSLEYNEGLFGDDIDKADKWYQDDLKKIESFKVFCARYSYELLEEAQ